MASKKAGRLAGLAALAGLAYMATRDKGGTKAAAPAAKDARTYAEVHEDEDAQAGINMGTSAGRKMGEEMLARGEAEGKKIDGSDQSAGPATTKDTEFGDLEGAMKRNAETKTTPAKVASVIKAPSASSAPVAKTPIVGGPTPARDPGGAAKRGGKSMDELMSSYQPRRPDTKLRDAAFTGNGYKKAQYTNKVLSEMGAQTRGPTIGNAKAVEAPGGDRSTRSDNAKPVFAPGGNRSVRNFDYENDETEKMKRGGKVKKMASGGMTSSASKRGDGIATKGKTRGRMC